MSFAWTVTCDSGIRYGFAEGSILSVSILRGRVWQWKGGSLLFTGQECVELRIP